MVVLGTPTHESVCNDRAFPSKLVDGRTKSDHDESEGGAKGPLNLQ